MAVPSADKRRGVGSRIGWPLKIFVGLLLILLVLLILNAFALDNETKSAELNVPGAELVSTTSGQLQVLDTGVPPGQARRAAAADRAAGRTGASAAAGLSAALADARVPIVLIHGSAGAINWWDELIPLLKANHRVIAIDMLGYGGSDKPDSDYSIGTQANLVAQVLARLQVPEAVMVGHSLGGMVVTSLAEQSPGLVAGLVLIDSAPDSSFGGLSGAARATRTPVLGQALWRIAPDAVIRRNISQGFAPGFEVSDKYVDDVRAMTYPSYVKSAREGEKYTGDASLSERLEAAGKPLLVIFGEEDQIFDAREALSAYAAIPAAETFLIPDSGHSPQVEVPDQTAKLIDDFTRQLATSRARENIRGLIRAKARARLESGKKAKATEKTKAGEKNRGKETDDAQSASKPGRGKKNGTGNHPSKQEKAGSSDSAAARTESPDSWKPTPAGSGAGN